MITEIRKIPILASLVIITLISLGCGYFNKDPFIDTTIQPTETIDIALLQDEKVAFCHQPGIQDVFGKLRTDIVLVTGSDTTVVSLPDLKPNGIRSIGCFSIRGPMWTGDYAMAWGKTTRELVAVGGINIITTNLYFIEIQNSGKLNFSIELDTKSKKLFFDDPRFVNGDSAQNRYLVVGKNALGTPYQNIWLYYPTRNGRSVRITNNNALGFPYASASWSPAEKYIIAYGSREYPGFEIFNAKDDTNVTSIVSFLYSDHAGLTSWPYGQGLIALGPVELQEILIAGSIPEWLSDDRVIFIAPMKNNDLTAFIYDLKSDTFEPLDERLSGVNGLFRLSPDRTQLAIVHYTSWRRTDKAAILLYDLTTREIKTIAVLDSGENKDVFVTGLNWSPDGNHIAFSSNHNGESDIYIINREGTAWVNIAEELDGDAVYPIWSPIAGSP